MTDILEAATTDAATPESFKQEEQEKLHEQGFTIWTVDRFDKWQPPTDSAIVSDTGCGVPFMSDGSVYAVVGAGGVGKTRWAQNLAVAQILGREFCGLRTHSPARTWLFIGNENSKSRLKSDLKAMCKNLPEADRKLIGKHLLLHVQEKLDDALLDCLDDEGRKRWQATLQYHRPDVIAVDPFEAVAPDSNDAGLVRDAMTNIKLMAMSVNDRATVIYIHHARTGAANTAQAIGYNAANFVKGSKTFFSICRGIINIAQGDAEDRNKIVIACGKSNDSPHFDTRGAVLDADTMTYEQDLSFDQEAWLADVEGKRNPNKKCTIGDVVMVVDSGKHARKDIVDALKEETGAQPRTTDRRIKDSVKAGYIEGTVPKGSYILTDKGRAYAARYR